MILTRFFLVSKANRCQSHRPPEVNVASLQTRVVNILKQPKSEWSVIAAESTDVGRLYREYIIPPFPSSLHSSA